MPRQPRDPDPVSLVGFFASELARLRDEAGLSMAQLGELLGCSPQWIGQIEVEKKVSSEEFADDLDTFFKTDGLFHRLWRSIKRATNLVRLPPGFPEPESTAHT